MTFGKNYKRLTLEHAHFISIFIGGLIRMTEEKTGSVNMLFSEQSEFLPPTGVTRKSFLNGWELIDTFGCRPPSVNAKPRPVSIRRLLQQMSGSLEQTRIIPSTPSEADLLNSFALFMGRAFGCTKDTEEKFLEMFMPPLKFLLAIRVALEREGIGATDIQKPQGEGDFSLPLNQRD